MGKPKSQKVKEKNPNSKPIKPEIVDTLPPEPVMDGTSHTEISVMLNRDYASEIIQAAQEAFDLKRLKQEKKKGINNFLWEGERQIFKLWHSVVALDTHNTLFVTLFLIAIGKILNEIKETLKPHQFTKWRRKTFHYKHERYLQQAQQLATIGPFAEKYASMGKKRLLALDYLRKTKNQDDPKKLLSDNPLPKQVEETLPTYQELKSNPFPDSTEDVEGDLLKEHVDAIITHDRLIEAGVKFANFDHAQLIAALNKDAITKKKAREIKALLDTKSKNDAKEELFNRLLLDKMMIAEKRPRKDKATDSLNQLLANFVQFINSADLENEKWIKWQRTHLDILLGGHHLKERLKFVHPIVQIDQFPSPNNFSVLIKCWFLLHVFHFVGHFKPGLLDLL